MDDLKTINKHLTKISTAYSTRNLPQLIKSSKEYLKYATKYAYGPRIYVNIRTRDSMKDMVGKAQVLFSALYIANKITEISRSKTCDFDTESPYLLTARLVMGEYNLADTEQPLIPWLNDTHRLETEVDSMYTLLILGLYLKLKEHNPLAYNLNMYQTLNQIGLHRKRSDFESGIESEMHDNTEHIFRQLQRLTHNEFMSFLEKGDSRHSRLLLAMLRSEDPEYKIILLELLSEYIDDGWFTLYNTNIFQHTVMGKNSLTDTVKELIRSLSTEIKNNYDTLENIGFEIEDIMFKLPTICIGKENEVAAQELPLLE